VWYDTGIVDQYLDLQRRQDVLGRLSVARDKASNAWFATFGNNGDHQKAIKLWREIFGHKFPAYG
jgi:hypothetical protein